MKTATTIAPDGADLRDLKVNPDWAKLPLFDRTGWKRVRFGDVVENVNETCDPAEVGIERFIGLEHLEPGSLQVHAWGNVTDGTTFTRRCKSGQVLFGKRRAYQRKVAVAGFDAVVSGDIYVFAAKNDRLLPELLPFLCLSEQFYKFAVETSAGSLSPRTNWTHLAQFELALPPLDQQHRIAEILWASDAAAVTLRTSLEQHANGVYLFTSSVTLRGLKNEPSQDTALGALPKSWACKRIEELTTHSAYGPRFPSSSYSPEGNVYQIRTTDFNRMGGINFLQVPAAKLDDKTIALHRLNSRDFLLSRSGEYAGLTAIFADPVDGRAYIPGAFLIRYRLHESLDAEYLLALCNSAFGRRFVQPLSTGSAQPNISGSAFSRLLIPVPPVDEQRAIVAAISRFQAVGLDLAQYAARTRALRSVIVNTSF